MIHLVAMDGVCPSLDDILLYENVNIKGTLNLTETMRKYGVKNFICTPSSTIYGSNEKIPFFGDCSSERDYTYIGDIISGISVSVKYMEKQEKKSASFYEIVNLGGNKVISLEKMVKTLEEKSGYRLKLKKMDFQKGDMKMTCSDISKAEKLLGYSPKTSFEDGITEFVNRNE